MERIHAVRWIAQAIPTNHDPLQVQLLGPRHVGIGLDSVSDPATLAAVAQAAASKYPEGRGYDTDGFEIATPEDVPPLTARMAAAGYAEDDIRAILGGNWLRLAREVWKVGGVNVFEI